MICWSISRRRSSIFAETTLPICAHCEDESTVQANRAALDQPLTIEDHSRIRDVAAAVIASRRSIDLAVRHQHRFHVLHVSTADEIPLLAPARPWVTAEVCPHHLLFSTEDYRRLGSLVQMNPSIKPPDHPPRLWQALLDGQIQVIATDHAPHTIEEKSQPYPQSPSGLPAVENSLPLMLDQVQRGRCTLIQVAHWMSDAPARVWGLVGKGRIAVGYDADLVLVDLEQQRTIDNALQWTRSGWSPGMARGCVAGRSAPSLAVRPSFSTVNWSVKREVKPCNATTPAAATGRRPMASASSPVAISARVPFVLSR